MARCRRTRPRSRPYVRWPAWSATAAWAAPRPRRDPHYEDVDRDGDARTIVRDVLSRRPAVRWLVDEHVHRLLRLLRDRPVGLVPGADAATRRSPPVTSSAGTSSSRPAASTCAAGPTSPTCGATSPTPTTCARPGTAMTGWIGHARATRCSSSRRWLRRGRPDVLSVRSRTRCSVRCCRSASPAPPSDLLDDRSYRHPAADRRRRRGDDPRASSRRRCCSATGAARASTSMPSRTCSSGWPRSRTTCRRWPRSTSSPCSARPTGTASSGPGEGRATGRQQARLVRPPAEHAGRSRRHRGPLTSDAHPRSPRLWGQPHVTSATVGHWGHGQPTPVPPADRERRAAP